MSDRGDATIEPHAGLSTSAVELLHALRAEPLDAHQLASELAWTEPRVRGTLDEVIDAGLVRGATVESGRQAWGLTIRGRARITL